MGRLASDPGFLQYVKATIGGSVAPPTSTHRRTRNSTAGPRPKKVDTSKLGNQVAPFVSVSDLGRV